MEVFEKYLSYEGSLAKGLVRFTITYKPPPAILSKQNQPPVKYEELWYQNGKCVGLKRLKGLPVRKNWQGVANFYDAAGSIGDHSRETANVATRLLADVNLKGAILAGVIVPASSFDRVALDLSYFKFLPLEQVPPTGEQHLSLNLIPFPLGQRRCFFYENSNQ